MKTTWPAINILGWTALCALGIVGGSSTGMAQSLFKFQQGVDHGNGLYSGATDVSISEIAPTTNFEGSVIDYVDGGPNIKNLLLRFDGIVGPGAGQIPFDTIVVAASLTVSTGASPAGSNNSHSVHQLLEGWDASTVTWANAFGGDGIAADDVEAVSAGVAVGAMGQNTVRVLDVTGIVQSWADGASNDGVAFLPGGSDGLGINLAEAADPQKRPLLTVIVLPAGAASYADAVFSFDPVIQGGEPLAKYLDPTEALGAPDPGPGPDAFHASLGSGGSISLEFTDNSLTGSGNNDPDLWIYEVGTDVEDTFVDVSVDGITWLPVGKVFGGTASIDLDAFGFGPMSLFSFVRLTDDPNEGNTTGPTVGADIDAVAAIASSPWINQGCALAGISGDPLLVGTGTLADGSLNSADLSNTAPSALAGLFLALSSTPVPFKGGTLKPVPFFTPVFLTTSPSGTISIPFVMPSGVPAGTELWVQWALQDAVAINGVALSNAILGVTP